MDVPEIISNINSKLNWKDFINELEELGFNKRKHIQRPSSLEKHSVLGADMLIDNLIEGGAIQDASLLHLIPHVIFRPLNEKQLASIVILADKYKIPLSFAGGKTGLSGAYSNFGAILDLADLHSSKKPFDFDLNKEIVRVEQRVLVSDLIKKIPYLSEGKYIFPIQPASAFKLPVRIGGIISTDASGVTSGKLGSVINWLVSMRVMTPKGEIIEVSRKDPNFIKIVGGNGYFGIVLEAVFKLYKPKKEMKQAIIFGEAVNTAFQGLQRVLDNKIFPLVSEFVISPFKLPGKFGKLSEKIKWATLIQGSRNEVVSFIKLMKEETDCISQWLSQESFDDFLQERSTFALIVQTSDKSTQYIAFPGFEDVLSPPKYLPDIITSINYIFEQKGFQKIIFGYGHINFRQGKGLLLHVRLPVPINFFYKKNRARLSSVCETVYEVIQTLKNKYSIKHKAEHSPGPFKIWLDSEFRSQLRLEYKQGNAFRNPHLLIFQELLFERYRNKISNEQDLIKIDQNLSPADKKEMFVKAMKLYLNL